jgi:hypothetical protein
MLTERAWKVVEPPVDHEEDKPVQVSLNAAEVAAAIAPRMTCEPCRRSSSDDHLIWWLVVAVGVLAVTSVLSALISALTSISNAKTLSKLELLMR